MTPSKRSQGHSSRLSAAERREQILAVAADVFRERPYGDVSLDRIAAQSGVARGLINHHFGTKRELYVEVVRGIMGVPALPIPDDVHGDTLERRVDASIARWLDAIERDRDIWLDSLRTAGMGDPEIAAIAEDAREEAVRRAVQVMGLGSVDELGPERTGLMRAWLALAEGAVLQWLAYGRLTKQQVHSLAVDTAVRVATGLIDEFAAVIGETAASTRRDR